MFPKSIRFPHRSVCAAAISLCVALSLPSYGHAAERFDSPQVDGIPMEGCLDWGNRCNKTAADYFCDLAHYQRSAGHDMAGGSDTKTLVTKQFCDHAVWLCGHFTYIQCAGPIRSELDSHYKARRLSINRHLADQSFSVNDPVSYYRITLPVDTGIAILSTGPMDLKGRLYGVQGGRLVDIDTDPGSPDETFSRGYTDITRKTHTNFMLRPGRWDAELQRRIIPAGTYYLAVELENNTFSPDTYGITFLERPSSAIQFFDGLDALLGDKDEDNDYLDIYVKGLYPEIYDKGKDWHHSLFDSGIVGGRQCKALPNFFLQYVLNKPYLLQDAQIYGNFEKTDDHHVLRGEGTLIYNGSAGFGDIKQARMGDVFAYKLKHHVGLYRSNQREIIDANYSKPLDGRLRKAKDTERWDPDSWKVVRPE